MSKKTGVFTPNQQARLPEEGYVLSFFIGTSTYKSTSAYCIMNGEVKYIRYEEIHGGHWSSLFSSKWNTLLWSCMPTKKQIANPTPEETFHHFKTHEEMIAAFPTLPKGFDVKAPNDFKKI